MKLLIDVGNTAIKFAKVEDQKIDFIGRLYTHMLSIEALDRFFLAVDDFDEVIISSVVPSANSILKKYIKSHYPIEPCFIKIGDYPELKIEIENPSELGVDLYCDIVQGYQLAKESNKPTLVIDMGTASKILLIDEEGVFNSCVIIPGIEISKKTLSSSTAMLPFYENLNVKKLTEARNTIDVINSSIYYAHIESINGLINRIEKEIGRTCNYVLTGGNAPIVEKEIKEPHVLDPLVCFKGMYQIVRRR